MDEHKQRLDKEYETQQASFSAQARALEQKHEREKENARKQASTDETRLQRQIQQKQELDTKQFVAKQKKDYNRCKEDMRRVSFASFFVILMLKYCQATVLPENCILILIVGSGSSKLAIVKIYLFTNV